MHLLIILYIGLLIAPFSSESRATQEKDTNADAVASKPLPHNAEQSRVDQIIIESFGLTHDGWSSDEVILNDRLNRRFIAACKQELPEFTIFDLNWRLMNLRKAGKLTPKTTKSNRIPVGAVTHIAEIAARSLQDKLSISTDKIMADPKHREAFNQIAQSVDPTSDLYQVRKAAFQLRKARKLRPELITRIADWGRVIESYSITEIKQQPKLIPEHPGIYIFRDPTGYLYIGQTDDLRSRLKTHLDQSHNQSFATYLGENNLDRITVEIHSFAPDSRAKESRVRRAYESELISSRKPKFNIQP
ncbi:MAG: GIY-YIG nuclease family protein [Mariniblastus sp.]|nr:GIY-YIG nuclease family protein [Mariniblastus sp.]